MSFVFQDDLVSLQVSEGFDTSSKSRAYIPGRSRFKQTWLNFTQHLNTSIFRISGLFWNMFNVIFLTSIMPPPPPLSSKVCPEHLYDLLWFIKSQCMKMYLLNDRCDVPNQYYQLRNAIFQVLKKSPRQHIAECRRTYHARQVRKHQAQLSWRWMDTCSRKRYCMPCVTQANRMQYDRTRPEIIMQMKWTARNAK